MIQTGSVHDGANSEIQMKIAVRLVSLPEGAVLSGGNLLETAWVQRARQDMASKGGRSPCTVQERDSEDGKEGEIILISILSYYP